MSESSFSVLWLTKQQAQFLLDCIRFADMFTPRVDPRLFETLAPELVGTLQQVAGGE